MCLFDINSPYLKKGNGDVLFVHTPFIPNDNQIYKVSVEKMPLSKQNQGLGHLVVRKYEARNKT
jgi:hypothetical protein